MSPAPWCLVSRLHLLAQSDFQAGQELPYHPSTGPLILLRLTPLRYDSAGTLESCDARSSPAHPLKHIILADSPQQEGFLCCQSACVISTTTTHYHIVLLAVASRYYNLYEKRA